MKKIEIIVDNDTLSLEAGRITGCLYLRIEDSGMFPEANWNDFVCIVISWWLNNNRNVQLGGEQETFMFMDGPLKYVVERRREKYNFYFWHRGSIISEIEDVDYTVFNSSLINAASALVTSCHKKGFISNELLELENALAAPH